MRTLVLGVRETRKRFTELLQQLRQGNLDAVVVTHYRVVVAILLSHDYFEDLEDTIFVLRTELGIAKGEIEVIDFDESL